MQQGGGYQNNTGRFVPGSAQVRQYSVNENLQVNVSAVQGGMQQSTNNIYPQTSNLCSGVSYVTQPPPYSTTAPQLSPFQAPMNPVQHSPYQSPQPAFPQQQFSAVNENPAPANLYQMSGSFSAPSGSMVALGTPSASPRSVSPRKSITGMMSPIRLPNPPMNMPPSSPVVAAAGHAASPASPLSVYISGSQQFPRAHQHSPRSFFPGSQVCYNLGPPPSPSHPHPVQYSPSMRLVSSPVAQFPTHPQSAPPSPRINPSPSQASPGLRHASPLSALPQGMVAARPFKAARQLDMSPSFQDASAYSGGSSSVLPQPTINFTPLASSDAWNDVSAQSVVPSLPILSSDTLDLLSTLTVSTVSSPARSHSVATCASEPHMQRSPLLQQHLLMPKPPIKAGIRVGQQADPGSSLKTSSVYPEAMRGPVSVTQEPGIEDPPSRSNHMHNARKSLISKEEKEKRLDTERTNSSANCTVTDTPSIVKTMANTGDFTPVEVTSLTTIADNKSVGDSSSEVFQTTSSSNSIQDPFVRTSHALTATTVSLSTMPVACVTTAAVGSPITAVAASVGVQKPVENPPVASETLDKRERICKEHKAELKERLESYNGYLTELFFLQNGGNYMDFIQFKKRPSHKLLEYLKRMTPDAQAAKNRARHTSRETLTNGGTMSPSSDISSGSRGSRKVSSDDGKVHKVVKTSEPLRDDRKALKPGSQRPALRESRVQDKSEAVPPTLPVSANRRVMTGSAPPGHLHQPKGAVSPLRLKRLSRHNTSSSALDESIGSQEEILERAKQEAVIQRKVVELRKQGLWTQRRLPKVQEPPRNKTHWDYLLEEMRWLSADFAQERKWKRAAARKLVRTVAAYHKEQHDKVIRAEREEQNRLRRVASTMAREIRIFWNNIGKVVEYKQRSLLDEKRQKALDLHLSYIVDQTEKYSDWLTQGLNKQAGADSSPTRSLNSSKRGSDDEFLPQGESSDDEETIAIAEQEVEKSANEEDEISILKQESQLPFDELLNSLPPELIENIGKPLEGPSEGAEGSVAEKGSSETPAAHVKPEGKDSDGEGGYSDGEDSKPTPISLRRSARKRKISEARKDSEDDVKKKKLDSETIEGDQEFNADDSGEDDEATVEAEEMKENVVDHEKEIKDLQAEGEMPIEELLKMYAGAFDEDAPKLDEDSEEEEDADEDEPEEENVKEEESSDTEESDGPIDDDLDEEIGMDYLFKADDTKDDNVPMILPKDETEDVSGEQKKVEAIEQGSPNKEITDVAAEAASLQPTGFTLATTQVVTPIPVLLKHTLREYQHIGLDWLVTMYDKRLNGILADEMGLGKTIQTIALLAHLACEKGVWGPHLIVVPTSVMLNWEMEFKKWCPGFKILTYYGSQKERKAKRTGWTKSNAFHVCITSYKLVLQDNVSFRRKKWKYLVLDEAQNIKNFKSQRWQTLLNFNSQRRLLLTGTPLQNNLMELWSLMHFLMPHVFQSHKEFKEWFSNPLTGMIEGSQDYNEKLVRRLHKVLRPFLLRRIKKDVEKQMPNKYEHVIRCHLSKRQRFLYEDFMSRAATKDTLTSGHFMSVINVLMQLRKVCNHPNLFEPRSIISPFLCDRMNFETASLVTKAMEKDPFEKLNLRDHSLHLPTLCNIHRYNAERLKKLQTPRKLIEELDCESDFVAAERPVPKSLPVREQLSNLLKEKEKQRAKNTTLSLHLTQGSQQLPVLTLPTSSNGGSLQFATASGARVITIPQSKSDGETFTIAGAPSSRSGTIAPQGFTLQYQTPQGTKVTIPNKQIRHLPGGMVQIVTSGMATKGDVVARVDSPSPATQPKAQEAPATAAKMDVTESDEFASLNLGVHENEALAPSLYSEVLKRCRVKERKERLSRMARMNGLRCEEEPGWLPRDTVDFLKNIFRRPTDRLEEVENGVKNTALLELVKPYETKLAEYTPITDRFVFNVPKVQCTSPCLHVPHPSPSASAADAFATEKMLVTLNKVLAPFHSVRQAMRIQFPEARLIQYDCGKLQVLNVYLRRFWTEKHRCLIFTQMTKVLDILEAFLSYHGYRYLRLDGSTRVEQRMSLMERFNNDPRIFCFILSTRSGGVGVNLTGADTVIFYDSDWNPTMDAQAQDRCHRIGQTRDVNIYRLISERTVEENILKKANQKRLLGDLAIEGGSFTTAFFKEQAIKDLFNEPTGLEELSSSVEKESKAQDEPVAVLSKPITARQKALAAAKEAEAKASDPLSVNTTEEVTQTDESPAASAQVADKAPKAAPNTWEDALQETEDKEDVDAAKLAKEEQDAEMEEFLEEKNADGEDAAEGQVSKLQEELKSLYEELTPVEQYALRYLEETTEEVNREELELAEEQVHQSKKDWEISHLMALKEEEERRLEEEDEIFYTREDAENQVYIDDVTGETMPIWFPPTPPQDENDVYIDPITCLLYRKTPMLDDQLPVITVKKERKRTKTEHESPGGMSGPKRKVSRAEIHAPKSLFNRPLSHLKKRDSKSHKFRPPIRKVPVVAALPHAKPVIPASAAASADKENMSTTGDTPTAGAAVAATPASVAEAVTTDAASTKSPEWLINEDWKLLQAVQQVLEMPLSLVVMMPAHTPNWDLVADIVNSIGSVFRSPKMCKQRFENVIAPREEGRSSVEISLKKKLKGTKTLSKLKASKPQKTTSMHLVDNNFQHTTLYSSRFDAIKEAASRRTVPSKSSGSGQFQRNPKHTSILMENGIAYDKPLPPVQVASLRAERIAREKQAIEAAKQQQQLVQSQTMQHTNTMSQLSTSQVTKTAGISTSGVSQLTAIPLSGGASNIIVNSSALSALTKKMSQQQNMAQFSVATPKTAKATLSGAALQQTLLRSASGGAQTQQQIQQPQIQIQQQSQVGTMVTVGLLHRLSNTGPSSSMTTAVANNNTITLSSLTRPSITVPAGAFITNQQQIQKQISQQLSKQQQQQQQQQRLQQQQTQLQLQKQQQKKTMKPQITPQRLQITPEAMKQLRKQQQLEASVVTVTKLPGKQRKTTPITQQELEQLLAKNPAMRRSVSKGQTAQVQIAPAAQIQAQQVQVAAAQQAAQQVVTSKPLPITVPVSNLVSVAAVNLGGVNITTSSAGTSVQQKSLQVPMSIQQQLLQRQVMKQRLVPQQQSRQGPVLASKVAGKQTVYAMVAGPPITQTKRRSGVASTSGTAGNQQQAGVQQPVQLTVTKLLQSQAVGGQPTAHIKQAFVQQGSQAVSQQQIRTPQMAAQLQQQQVSATIVPSNMTQHRLITPQRQVRQIQQLVSNQQMVLAQASPVASSQQFSHRQNPSVVASISIPAVSGGAAGHLTLSSPTQQSGNQSQQLQNLPQVQMRTQGSVAQQQARTTMQQPQLVLSQISPQAQMTPLSTPVTPTTMTLAPSLVQLPIVSTAPNTTGAQALSGQVSLPSGPAGTQMHPP